MKIHLEILGMPDLAKILGKTREIEFPRGTVGSLIEFLVKEYSPKVERLLLDVNGQLDVTIQIILNDQFLPRESISRQELKDGDHLKLMLLVGGG